MHDKLVDTAKPGDRVEVRPILRMKWIHRAFIFLALSTWILLIGHWDLQGHECESWTNTEICKIIIQGAPFVHFLKNRIELVSCAEVLA